MSIIAGVPSPGGLTVTRQPPARRSAAVYGMPAVPSSATPEPGMRVTRVFTAGSSPDFAK